MLIIRLRWVPFIDITGLQTLEEVIIKLHKRGIQVLLCDARGKVRRKLGKAGILDLIGRENYLQNCHDSVARSRALLAPAGEESAPQ